MPDSTVTLKWNEPLSHFGISPEIVDEAIKRGVKEYLLQDEEFRKLIAAVIEASGKEITKEALFEVFKNAIVAAFQDKISAQKVELLQCLRDFQAFKTQHASEYADRRFKELLKKIDELDAM